MKITLEQAKKIPWHRDHNYGAVDKNGDYCRFITFPKVAHDKCWIGDGILAPQVADVICEVKLGDEDEWKLSLHPRGDK